LGLLLDNTWTKSLVDVLNILFNFAGAEEDLGKALKAKGQEVSKLLDPIIMYMLSDISSSICSFLLWGKWLVLLCAWDLALG
jgi:hypothetical protein